MGVYYQAVCRDRREQIDPCNYLDGGKFGTVVRGRFANLLAFVMAGRWLGEKVQMLGDAEREYVSDEKGDFADVTLEELAKYQREFPDEEED